MRFLFLAFALTLLLIGCSERTDRIEKKLEAYLQEDLKFMVAETMKAGSRDGMRETAEICPTE